MPKINYLLVADQAYADTNQKGNFIGVFDKVTIPKGQTTLTISFAVVGQIREIPKGATSIRVSLVDPNNLNIGEAILSGEIEEGQVVNILVQFNVITFHTTGIYKIKVEVNNVVVESDQDHYFNITSE